MYRRISKSVGAGIYNYPLPMSSILAAEPSTIERALQEIAAIEKAFPHNHLFVIVTDSRVAQDITSDNAILLFTTSRLYLQTSATLVEIPRYCSLISLCYALMPYLHCVKLLSVCIILLLNLC